MLSYLFYDVFKTFCHKTEQVSVIRWHQVDTRPHSRPSFYMYYGITIFAHFSGVTQC